MTEIPVLVAGVATAGKMCSICQCQIVAGEQILRCPECKLPFHSDCWNENGGCAQYGCKCAPQDAKAQAGLQTSNVWGEEKPCPACRRIIKSQALKCRFCGAGFESADLITSDEYSSREYEGSEYVAARNKVIGMFFAAITGCLSPLMVILFAVLIFGKSFAGVQFRRLPATVRALAWIGFGLSAAFVLLFILFIAFD